MAPRRVLLLLAVAALSLAAEQRVVHRLVGGHLRAPPHHRGEPLDSDDDAQEMVEASASGSKEKTSKKGSEDEDKKTLSQQVAEGKYGLIQKELFQRPPKRPGILSYHDNDEVPKDNRHTLGGLSKNEIWLAENHLLVLRGGIYPPHDDHENAPGQQLWPPIDDYHAPLHQVKIPKNPKVPPPFPVRLGEGAPLQVLGPGNEGPADGAPSAPPDALHPAWLPPPAQEAAPQANGAHKANSTAGPAALPVPGAPAQGEPPGGLPGGLPFPPSLSLNGTWPPYFASLPPNAAFLPPPNGNQSEILDEDDPSIYYPPPYSFYYPVDNSSKVPPGPLVPGIVLPPPPEFFAPLEDTTTTKKPRYRKPTTPTTTQIRPTTTLVPLTTKPKKKKPTPTRFVPKIKNTVTSTTSTTTTTTEKPTVVTILPVVTSTLSRKYLPQQNRTYFTQRTEKPRKKPSVTILRPVKTTTASPKVYVYENEVKNKPYYYESPRTKTVVSTTQVPLRYFTTGNEIETNSVTNNPEKYAIDLHLNPPAKSPASAQIYYYEEDNSNNLRTTSKPPKRPTYFNEEDYFAPPKPPPPVRKPQTQYIYVTSRPHNTQKPRYRLVPQKGSDSFSIHIAQLQNQIHQYYPTRGTTRRPSKPLYQYSFEATHFRPSPQLDNTDSFRPVPKYSVQIQQAIEIIPSTEAPGYQHSSTPVFQSSEYYTTPRPSYKAQNNQGYQVTAKPISQYSFEVTPNPVYQGYYTKPDESHFDENTKQYFTMFGRKLPQGTTPISTIEQSTQRPNAQYYQYDNPSPQYQPEQKPISLESDINVNYVNPRPQINPDAEIIDPANYQQPQRGKAIQYVRPQGTNDEKPEIVKAVPVEVPASQDQGGSYISYQLPGDEGAHFYFLTPQLAQSTNQGAPFYHNQGYRERRNQRSPGPRK